MRGQVRAAVDGDREGSLWLQKVMGGAIREPVGGPSHVVPPKAGDRERMGRGERHVLPFWQA